MRFSGAVKIKTDELDLAHSLLTVFGKGQKERKVPFSNRTRKELGHYINNFRERIYTEHSPYLFPTATGDYISVNNVQQFIRRLAKKAGLEGIRCSPHVFRHTFATLAIANGANLFVVKEIMGHASLQTTLKTSSLLADTMPTKAPICW